MDQSHIRNFCIIAHIDHGKSTLSDRLLEMTGAIDKRKMKDQVLDSMDLEREKGITIKLAPARMTYKGHVLNLIDTPGHVDFTYEVSRSLAAVEGAILLIDSTQGVQAQTVANLFLALDQNLTIIPVLNKIDLPAADVPKRTEEIIQMIGCKPEDILSVSGKTGENVDKLLDAIIDRIPPPVGDTNKPLRALIFDSAYDDYRGVVAYVRVVDGEMKKGSNIRFVASGSKGEAADVGAVVPGAWAAAQTLETGQIGYLVTGLKDITSCRVGDTIVPANVPNLEALPGYKVVNPMVYAGIFPNEGDDFQRLREAVERLTLNDAALTYEPEHSPALGYGFRVGLLGMLHMEIVKERLFREHGIDLIMTVPSVAYKVTKTNGEEITIKSPLDLPDQAHVISIQEPWVNVDIVVPSQYVGAVMQLVSDRRGTYRTTEYLSADRAVIRYEMPLAMVIVDFYDKLKGATAGYASLSYEMIEYREAEVVKMDILVAEEIEEAFSTLVYRDEAERAGRRILLALKESIPRQWFVIKLQAAIGGKVVASEHISALRKDVTAKLYGGDVTRKRKLLDKQKKGKARMAEYGKGKVQIPTDAYLNVLKR